MSDRFQDDALQSGDDAYFADLERSLAELANQLTSADHQLLTPPEDLWVGIESAVAAPPEKALLTGPKNESWFSSLRITQLGLAAALVAVAGFALLFRPGAGGELIASAEINNDELPVAFDDNGLVELRQDGDDIYLQIDVPELPASGDGFYEVWMIDAEVEGMISLGVLAEDGRIDAPDGVDYTAFPVVDISFEPLDGDPTHSGQSILRGVLTAL